MNGIGPALPLGRDDKHGVYVLITSYKEEVKQNFKNLLLTSPGERTMDPAFGVGLRRFLFEPRTHLIPQIRQKIEQQVGKYMPYIKINNIDFDVGHHDSSILEDSNILSIKIIYNVPSINLQTFIVVASEEIN